MKRTTLLIVVLGITWSACSAQSAEEGHRPSGCKLGNLLQESDPSLIDDMGRFLVELKTAVAKGDKPGVARLVHYPLSFATADSQFTIRSEREFIKKYDQILPPGLKDLLLRQEARCIGRVGAKGFTIGNGEIWFDRFQDRKVKIFGITAVTYPNE